MVSPAAVELCSFRQIRSHNSSADQTFEMTFAKQNAEQDGFNLWTINEVPFSGRPHATYVSLNGRQALQAADAQRERRHPSHPSSSA